jgi:hypothetical protein
VSGRRSVRHRRAALLALSLVAACGDPWTPTEPGFTLTGGPLATSESGTTSTFQLALTTSPKAAVDVDVLTGDASEGLLIAPGGTVPAPWITLHFTSSDWSIAQTVTVKGVDDAIRDGDVNYAIRIVVARSDDPDYAGAPPASVQVVNHDDDTPGIVLSRTSLATAETGATSDSFEAVLASQPTGLVSVPVTSGDLTEGLLVGGASGVTPAGSIVLLFTPSNWSTPQSVTVIAQLDYTVDGDQTYGLTVGPASGDPEYAALAPQAVTVVNADTDLAGLVLSTRTLSLAENSSASFGVRLATIPAEPVLVPIVSGDTTEALLGLPYSYSGTPSITLTFDATNWNVEQLVTVKGVWDYTVDGAQSLVVTVDPPTGDPPYAALLAETIDVTVQDSDFAAIGYAAYSGGELFYTSEAGLTHTLSFILNAAPMADVTVPITSDDTAEALLSTRGSPPSPSVELTFTPLNWNAWQEVIVSGVDDAILELGPPHLYTVTVGPTSSASAPYDGLAPITLHGSNADDEVASNEGTQANPVELTGLLPYAGMVGQGSSWYRVTGFPDGALVGIRGALDWAKLTIWDESVVPVKLCAPPVSFASPSSCAVRLPAGGSFLVQVDGSGSSRGSTFTLDVVPFTFATDLPLDFPDTGYVGRITSSVTLSGVPVPYARIALFVETSVSGGDAPIRIFLTSPYGGTTYPVFYDYSGGVGLDRTVFDDSAAMSILDPSALPPFAGTFGPHVTFAHPADANGTWSLMVYGDQPGTLVRWGIAAR